MSGKNTLLSIAVFALIFTSCELGGAFIPPPRNPNPPDNYALPTPAAPIALASNSTITLHWAAVEGAETYDVYLSTTQEPPELPVKSVMGTATILDGLVNKTVYYLWIRAVSEVGFSALSPRIQAVPWPDNEVPAIPQRPVIIPGVNQLTVTWAASGGALSYEVYINTRTVRPPLPEVATENTSVVIGNLENNQIYYLWIRAANNAGTSDFSPSEAGTPSIPTVSPSAPVLPVLTAGNRELFVSWQPVAMTAAYEVWVGKSDNAALAEKQGSDISGNITHTVITGLLNETVYHVWIRAKNDIGTSGFSPPANAMPSAFAALPAAPAAPTVISGSGQLTVNWQETEGALTYELWRGVSNNVSDAQKHGADVTGTTVSLHDVVNGTTYFFWVRAKNSIGESDFSPAANGTPSVFYVPPLTPDTAPVVTPGNGQLSVGWQAVEGASVYEIWTGTTNNTGTAARQGGDVSGLSAVITGLTNGTTYYVWIRAKNNIGASGFSPSANGTPSVSAVPPQAPSAPTVTIGNGQLTVNWTAVAGASVYEVWLGTINNSASATQHGADINAALSATISGLNNGIMYYIWLRAKNSSGTSGFSSVAIGMPIASAAAPALTAGNASIALNWTAIAGAEQYEVFFGTGINPPQTASQTITPPATTAIITGLANGTSYNVWIRGRNSSGLGAMSSPAAATPIGTMGAVTLNAGTGQLSLSWAAVAGAVQYEVFHSTTGTMPLNPTLTVTTTTAAITDLENGATYNVWVRGRNPSGTSTVSAVVSGRPLGTPGAPTLSPGFRQLTVTWTTVPGADEYEVYYGIGSATTLAMTTAETTAVITGLTAYITYQVRLRARNANGVSGFGPSISGVQDNTMESGLYRGTDRIGSQNLSASLTWIADNAVSGDEFLIMLGANETIDPAILEYSGRTVGITLMGFGSERTVSLLSSNGSMFTVNTGVTLTLEENVTLVGRNNNNVSLVRTSENSTLIMNDGAKIINNRNFSTNTNGGAINIGDGVFIMNGGEISGNNAFRGGGVSVSEGIFTMNGGEISGNDALNGGGGVHVTSGTFTMNDGKISVNNSWDNGGGINAVSGSIVTIINGKISGNIANTFGGGIYVDWGATVTMSGGIINGNIAREGGGVSTGMVLNDSAIFIKQHNMVNGNNSGIIYGSDVNGVDEDGVSLANTATTHSPRNHAIRKAAGSLNRNTTAWETDQIDTTTGRGLSANGNPPFGQ